MAIAHAILAALMDCPSSGYDLARRFDGSVGFFWEASHQQIYRELSKLEAAGHVTSETVQQDIRPNKKLYSLTDSGRAFLIEWLRIPSSISPIKDDLLVKLFSGHLVAPAILLTELRHHRKQHQLRLTEYQAIEDRLFPDTEALSEESTYPYLTLRNGIQLEQAWLRWCDNAIATLGSLQNEDPPQE
ncbi:MAG: PadR family transcriptional regulator [Leptolyngbyaceae cyanobacterium]